MDLSLGKLSDEDAAGLDFSLVELKGPGESARLLILGDCEEIHCFKLLSLW